MFSALLKRCVVALAILTWAALVQAAGFERRDVTFPSSTV